MLVVLILVAVCGVLVGLLEGGGAMARRVGPILTLVAVAAIFSGPVLIIVQDFDAMTGALVWLIFLLT